MDETASNEAILKMADGYAVQDIYEDLGVTQYNNSVLDDFVKLNIEKASDKIDRIVLNMFNDFVSSSFFFLSF